jgi:hypothetical protein
MVTIYYTIDNVNYVFRSIGIPQELITQEYILKQHNG